jgi:cytoskeleton protein RodZ
MNSFGDQLRREREAHGIPLEELARAIKVGQPLLEALERNDFASLPGGPFNKGFVRAYARHIGLDPEAAVDAYAREEQAQGLSTPDAHRELGHDRPRLVELRNEGDRKTLVLDWNLVQRVALSLLVAGVVGLGGWFLFRSGGPEAEARAPVAETEANLEASDAAVADPDTDPELDPDIPPVAQTAGGGGATASPAEAPADNPQPETAAEPPARPPAATQTAEDRSSDGSLPSRERATTGSRPGSGLSVSEAGVGTAIVNRRLVGQGDRFEEGSKIWFWTRSVGGQAGDPIHHVWLRDGRMMVTYDLTVGGPHWRNFSRQTLSEGSVGSWTVEARDAAGRVLARREFRCVPRESGSSAGEG